MFDAARIAFGAIPRPAFGRAAQHLPQMLVRTTTKAEARYMRAAKTAAELLPELPGPGEAVHTLMTGSYDLCQVITATVRRLPTLRHLRVATLCFSKRNTAELSGLLEERRGLKLIIVVSAFFKGHNAEMYERFASDLKEYPGTTLTAARSHCKVATFDIADDDGLVFEGSANLRSNRNREQLAVIRDRGLHDWHAAWIDTMMQADDDAES